MHRIDPQRIGDRQQHRRQDQDNRRHIHQRADHQQQDVDAHQNHILVIRHAGEKLGNQLRQLHKGHHRAETGGEGDQHHHNGDGLDGAKQQDMQLVPLKVAVDKHGDEEGPQTGDRRRFRGGENTGENAAEDNHHGEQPPEGVEKDLQRLLKGDAFAARITAFARKAETHHHQAEAKQQAGENTGDEQR